MKARYTDMSAREKADYLAKNPDCQLCGHIARSVDHDHETGLLRGALCQRCNSRLTPLDAALTIPTGIYPRVANLLHLAILRGETGVVASPQRMRDDVLYLGMTPEEYEERLRTLQAHFVHRFIYWAPVVELVQRDPQRQWSKAGPESQEGIRERLEQLLVPGPSHQDIVLTLEPENGVGSPHPRGIQLHRHETPGASEYKDQLKAAMPKVELDPAYIAKSAAYVRLAHPILLSRTLTHDQLRAAVAIFTPDPMPTTPDELIELFGDRYDPRFVDLAVRIALDDLGDDLPDPTWKTSFTRARWHWQKLCTHWLNRYAPTSE